MSTQTSITPSLVSVVIPCYNHSHYLPTAIESVLQQSHKEVEIVVVDDGSTDQTREVAQRYQQVKYVYQQNSGLSASRNTGIKHSSGQYLVFLDADDWLYPTALETNLRYLQQNPQLAFVSGAYDMVYVDENLTKEEKGEIPSGHYFHLLRRNYIGMIAAVLFQRWILEEFQYDTTLRACEDYDLYFRITRKYPVLHHTEKIAAYRIHTFNMSSNIPLMLNTILAVRKRQEKELKTAAEKKAYKEGQNIWKDYYCNQLYQKLTTGKRKASGSDLMTLLKYKPKLLLKYIMR
jgi:glycosyltransferase involved in cell wall biosynthesis